MSTKEEVSMVGFAIVALAGDARTALIRAMNKAQDGEFDQARELVKEANESIIAAHQEQTKIMSDEASGNDLEMTLIMTHGQDTLMTTMLLKDEMDTIINMYERIYRLEQKIKG